MRLAALALLFAALCQSADRSTPRSLPRDQAAAQRKSPASSAPRSSAARRAFQRDNPCPANGKVVGACPGYVVDHIVPLACGGLDAPANMQWQTTAAAKEKDRWERNGCR